MRFLRLIWRMVVLSAALVASAVAVVAAWLVALQHFAWDQAVRIDPFNGIEIHGVMSLMAMTLAMLSVIVHAFLPWVLAVTVSELLRLRHVGWHLAGGAIVALSAGAMMHVVMPVAELRLLLALGLVAGFVHWLIAGRNAGRWSETLTDTAGQPPSNLTETSEK